MEKFGAYRYCVRREYLFEEVDDVTIFGSRTCLNAETSFTGRDLLRTRPSFCLDTFTSRTQTFEGNLAFADEDFEDFNDEDANNDVEIEELTYFSHWYKHKLSLLLMVPMDNFASTVNFLDGEGSVPQLALARATLSTTQLGDLGLALGNSWVGA